MILVSSCIHVILCDFIIGRVVYFVLELLIGREMPVVLFVSELLIGPEMSSTSRELRANLDYV